MKTIRKHNILGIAVLCVICLTGLFPEKASAATVVVATGKGRYYYHGHYYSSRVWIAPKNGRRGYYRYR